MGRPADRSPSKPYGSCERGVVVRDADRSPARIGGAVVAAAGAGPDGLGSAHCGGVVASAESGDRVVITGDPDDLTGLASAFPKVQVAAI